MSAVPASSLQSLSEESAVRVSTISAVLMHLGEARLPCGEPTYYGYKAQVRRQQVTRSMWKLVVCASVTVPYLYAMKRTSW